MDAHRWDKCLSRGGDYVVKLRTSIVYFYPQNLV
jgi:hypothetical protein